MRCEVYKCRNNDGIGCCECSSYVTIDSTGECDSLYIPTDANEETNEIDRSTALSVLSELSNKMRPDYDLFGTGTLVIKRSDFETIRKKYLD